MRFEYTKPASLAQALEILDQGDERVKVLAGGTDLLVFIQEGVISPRLVVDLGGIAELKSIEEKYGRIRLGALVTHDQAAASPLIREKAPVLPQACAEVGSPQIRSRGTIGGNLVTASPSGDVIPALVALGASLALRCLHGERTVPIEEFFTGVKKSVLRHNELLTLVSFPAPAPSSRGFFKKLGQRKALSISKVSVAACLDFEKGAVRSCRIALGAVAPTVIRATKTEAYLLGKKLDRGTIAQAARIVSSESRAITDLRSEADYRNEMVGVLVKRGIEEIAGT
jgi:CO/xanthine dehydrogenase FAD-binding subunit